MQRKEEIPMKEEIHVYVNMPGFSPNFPTVGEALAAVSGQDAKNETLPDTQRTFPAPFSEETPAFIHIGKGIYREKLTVTRNRLTLLGEDCENTILVYGDGAFDVMEDNSRRGTFRTASFRIDANDFTARHLTFQNDAGFGHTAGQALALYAEGDRLYLEDCRLLGSQDTLFTAPLPLKEAKPGGFTGPGEHRPRVLGRQLYRSCFIQGDVDFIFGGGIAYFENCTIFSKLPGDRIPPESPKEETIYGYVTAASTPKGQPYGYVFQDCRLTSDCPPRSVYLGRPWREWAKTVFLHCELGEHIHPLGWNDWGKPHGHFYYGEYDSYGPGANPDTRADFSHQLTKEEAAEYTLDRVLQGWRP